MIRAETRHRPSRRILAKRLGDDTLIGRKPDLRAEAFAIASGRSGEEDAPPSVGERHRYRFAAEIQDDQEMLLAKGALEGEDVALARNAVVAALAQDRALAAQGDEAANQGQYRARIGGQDLDVASL